MFAANNTLTTIQVSNATQLQEAYGYLSNLEGGGVIEVTSDATGLDISLEDGGNQHVSITSADTSNPVTISRIATDNVENVSFSYLDVNSEGVDRTSWHTDLQITSSNNIEITNVNFSSFAEGLYNPQSDDFDLADNLGHIRNSSEVNFSDNTIQGYYQGLAILETTDITVSGNEIFNMQGDGIRLAGVADISITDNYLHDFYGVTQDFNHSDMIQMWSINTTIVSSNVTISGNILDSGDGAATQSIFINNEAYTQSGGDQNLLYSNFEISNNAIYNGHSNGISVRAVDGINIADNTLVWNELSEIIVSADDVTGVSSAPRINVILSNDIAITNNIASGISSDNPAVMSGNEIVDYTSPLADNYLKTHFIEVSNDDGWSTPLVLRPDSDWVGTGSAFTDPILSSDDGIQTVLFVGATAEDAQAFILDASFSVDEDGFLDSEDHTFLWTFEDGTIRTGAQVTHQFDDAGAQNVSLQIVSKGEVISTETLQVLVPSSELLILDLTNGLEDASPYETLLEASNESGFSDAGFHLSDGVYIIATRENDHYHDLESFGLSIDIKVNEGSSGRFMHLSKAFNASVDKDGSVTFNLFTDKGTFTVNSGDATIADGEPHTVSVGYSDSAETLVLNIDGTDVAEVTASGATAAQGSNGLVFGNQFGTPVDAVISNITINANASEVGITIDGAGVDKSALASTLISDGDLDSLFDGSVLIPVMTTSALDELRAIAESTEGGDTQEEDLLQIIRVKEVNIISETPTVSDDVITIVTKTDTSEDGTAESGTPEGDISEDNTTESNAPEDIDTTEDDVTESDASEDEIVDVEDDDGEVTFLERLFDFLARLIGIDENDDQPLDLVDQIESLESDDDTPVLPIVASSEAADSDSIYDDQDEDDIEVSEF